MPPTYSFADWRTVLQRAGFTCREGAKHEVWRKIDDDGRIWRVTLSRQAHGRDVPQHLHRKMLRQAGLSPQEYDRLLNG